MVAALTFVGGDEVIESFLLLSSDGAIMNLGGLTISGGVWWRERQRIALSTGVNGGISVHTSNPPLASEGETQASHGSITLTEAQTAAIPHGQVASLRLVAVTSDGVTLSSYFAPLERIA